MSDRMKRYRDRKRIRPTPETYTAPNEVVASYDGETYNVRLLTQQQRDEILSRINGPRKEFKR